MSDKFSQLLPVLGAIVAFLLAALLLVYIVRLVFGRRIRAPGPRNRPRRLDVVDVFDLDKERQLVIVRRDNIEHLLLIGGPNDVLVEGAINRIEGIVGRADPGRAEAPRPVTSQNWPAGPIDDEDVAPVPIKPAAPSGINLPPEMIAPKPPAPKPAPPPRPSPAPSEAESPAAPPPPSAPVAPKPPGQTAAPPAPLAPLAPLAPRPTPAAPPPLRPAATQRPAPPPFLARTQQIIKPRSEDGDASGGPEPSRPAPPPPPPARPAAPPPLRPAAPPPPPLRPAAPPVPPAAPSAGEPPKPQAPTRGQAEDALESLEEEMARLLGRPEKE